MLNSRPIIYSLTPFNEEGVPTEPSAKILEIAKNTKRRSHNKNSDHILAELKDSLFHGRPIWRIRGMWGIPVLQNAKMYILHELGPLVGYRVAHRSAWKGGDGCLWNVYPTYSLVYFCRFFCPIRI